VNKLFFVGHPAGFGVVIANVVGQIRRSFANFTNRLLVGKPFIGLFGAKQKAPEPCSARGPWRGNDMRPNTKMAEIKRRLDVIE
jgi:hypothetical protein